MITLLLIASIIFNAVLIILRYSVKYSTTLYVDSTAFHMMLVIRSNVLIQFVAYNVH